MGESRKKEMDTSKQILKNLKEVKEILKKVSQEKWVSAIRESREEK